MSVYHWSASIIDDVTTSVTFADSLVYEGDELQVTNDQCLTQILII